LLLLLLLALLLLLHRTLLLLLDLVLLLLDLLLQLLNLVLLLGLGLLLLVGCKTRWVALGMAIFVAVITPIFHNYWAVPEAQVMMQKLNFFKNYAITGGLLAFAAFGAGNWSIDGRRRG